MTPDQFSALSTLMGLRAGPVDGRVSRLTTERNT